MDKLPNEILGPYILGLHLNVRDLVRCKKVSKRFYWVIHNLVRVRELVLSDKIDEFPKGIWYGSNKPILYENAVESTFLKYDRLNLHRFLRRLHLGRYCNPNLSEFLDLNTYQNLEHIDSAGHVNCALIESASLRTFSCNAHGNLVFRTPNLRALKCKDLSSIFLSDPQQLTHLEVSNYNQKIKWLTGLEFLQLNYEGEIQLNRDLLQTLKRLKCLRLNPFDAAKRSDEFREFRNTCAYIAKQRLILRRTDLRIFLFGVELTSNALLYEYDLARGELYFQIANYDRLCNDLSCHQSVDYNHLLSLFDGPVPENYFGKFVNIRQVTLHGEVDTQFFAFLSKLDHFESLHLTDTMFTQPALDRLPDKCSRLTELRIEQCDYSPINYEFILSFRFLRSFFTTQYSPDLIDMAVQSTQQLEYLQSFIYHKKLPRYNLRVTLLSRHKDRFYFVTADLAGPTSLNVDIQPHLGFDGLMKVSNDLKEKITDEFFFLFIGTRK